MRAVIFCGVLLAMLLWTPSGAAQPFFVDRPVERGVALEVLADRDEEHGWGDDASWFVTSYLSAVGPKIWGCRLVVELPFAYGQVPRRGDLGTTYVLGNPFVGVVAKNSARRVRTMAGIRVPLRDNEALALRNHHPLRAGAFRAVWTIVGTSEVERAFENLIVTARMGVMLTILRDDGWAGMLYLPAVLQALPGVQVRFEGEHFSIGNAIQGVIPLILGAYEFPRRLLRYLTYQYEVAASVRFGRWQPGLRLRLPLHDDSLPVFNDGRPAADFGLTLHVAL